MQERAFRIDPLLTLHFGPDCLTSGATRPLSERKLPSTSVNCASCWNSPQLRELLEFSPAAIGIVDEAGRLLFHNARFREIFGYSQSEFSSILAYFGMTSISAHGSSNNCGLEAAKF